MEVIKVMHNFDWADMNEEDLAKASEVTIEAEDELLGFIFLETKDKRYIIDVHYEHYNSRDRGFDLEVYHELPEGGHGEWLGSIKEIKSARDFSLFKKRTEKLLIDFVNKN